MLRRRRGRLRGCGRRNVPLQSDRVTRSHWRQQAALGLGEPSPMPGPDVFGGGSSSRLTNGHRSSQQRRDWPVVTGPQADQQNLSVGILLEAFRRAGQPLGYWDSLSSMRGRSSEQGPSGLNRRVGRAHCCARLPQNRTCTISAYPASVSVGSVGWDAAGGPCAPTGAMLAGSMLVTGTAGTEGATADQSWWSIGSTRAPRLRRTRS